MNPQQGVGPMRPSPDAGPTMQPQAVPEEQRAAHFRSPAVTPAPWRSCLRLPQRGVRLGSVGRQADLSWARSARPPFAAPVPAWHPWHRRALPVWGPRGAAPLRRATALARRPYPQGERARRAGAPLRGRCH
jgi:hypothetical protein